MKEHNMDTTTPPQTPIAITAASEDKAKATAFDILNTLAEATPDPVVVKPGWKTSEFWFKVAATGLTVLFASGALTNSTALAIAGMAATVLTSLGYTVSRTWLKGTGIVLLVALVAAPAMTACSASMRAKTAAGVGTFFDCEEPSVKPLVDDAYPLAESWALSLIDPSGHKLDTSKAVADADKVKSTSEILRCAMLAAFAALSTPAPANPSSPQAAPVQVDPASARAAWATIRARHGWGDTHTAEATW